MNRDTQYTVCKACIDSNYWHKFKMGHSFSAICEVCNREQSCVYATENQVLEKKRRLLPQSKNKTGTKYR